MIRTVSVSGSRWTSVTSPNSHRTDFDPAWSPDGRLIAFARHRVREFDGEPAGPPAIFLISRDGSDLRRLTHGRSPSWSPDGRDLVFLSGGSIYRMSAEGGTRRLVVRGLRKPSLVRWSPDGERLLFTASARVDEPNELWVTNADGTERVRILHDAYVGGADWQPGS
jgi:Tol biopolymer transport system component